MVQKVTLVIALALLMLSMSIISAQDAVKKNDEKKTDNEDLKGKEESDHKNEEKKADPNAINGEKETDPKNGKGEKETDPKDGKGEKVTDPKDDSKAGKGEKETDPKDDSKAGKGEKETDPKDGSKDGKGEKETDPKDDSKAGKGEKETDPKDDPKKSPMGESTPANSSFYSFAIPLNSSFGEACLKLDIAFKIFITYNLTDNKTGEASFDMILNDYDGLCDSENVTYNKLVIRTDKNWNVTFVFNKNYLDAKRFKLSLVHLHYTVDENNFPKVNANDLGDKEADASVSKFETELGKSYKCSPATLNLNEFIRLELSHYQGQAFNNNAEFGPVEDCHAVPPTSPKMIALYAGLGVSTFMVTLAALFKFLRTRPGFERLHLEPTNSRFV